MANQKESPFRFGNSANNPYARNTEVDVEARPVFDGMMTDWEAPDPVEPSQEPGATHQQQTQ